MKVARSFYGSIATVATTTVLLLVGHNTVPAALAKDLSIGLVHRNWTIEKECSAELDQVQAALLAHVVATKKSLHDDDDDNKGKNDDDHSAKEEGTKSHVVRFVTLDSYDCNQVCPSDMSDAHCQRITRGYCSTTSGRHHRDRAEPQPDPPVIHNDDDDDENPAMPPTDWDVTTLDCNVYCQDVPNWLCRRITYGHCATAAAAAVDTSSSSSRRNATTAKALLAPLPPYHCPTFCQDVPAWICVSISQGSCNKVEDDSLTAIAAPRVSYYSDCTKICKDLPNWVCRRVSRGYCVGLYDESPSVRDNLVEQTVHRSNHSTTTTAVSIDFHPFHCPSYCADLPNWLCHRLTAGLCTGEERRGLTSADTFDELLLTGQLTHLPIAKTQQEHHDDHHQHNNITHRVLHTDCDTVCACYSMSSCQKLFNNVCPQWKPTLNINNQRKVACPGLRKPPSPPPTRYPVPPPMRNKNPPPYMYLPAYPYRLYWPTAEPYRIPTPRSGPGTVLIPNPYYVPPAPRPTIPKKPPTYPVPAPKRPTYPVRPPSRPTYPVRPPSRPSPIYRTLVASDDNEEEEETNGAVETKGANSSSSSSSSAAGDVADVALAAELPLDKQVPPASGATGVAAAAHVVDLPPPPVAVVGTGAANVDPPPPQRLQQQPAQQQQQQEKLLLSYHCPTFCRRVSPSLCARLTYGYCGNLVDDDEEMESTSTDTNTTTVGQSSLRGSSDTIVNNDNDDNEDCQAAIAAMTTKFKELVGDLDDQDCAIAIIKANIAFHCSTTATTSSANTADTHINKLSTTAKEVQ